MAFARDSLLALVLIVGCGSGDGGASGPVASTPLRGTVSGREFVGVSARARKSASKPNEKGPPRYLLISAPWQAGYAADFSFGGDGQLGSFVVDRSGTTTIVVSATGRIEVIEAPPDKGTKGKIRLRMSEKDESVEGEIVVEVCE